MIEPPLVPAGWYFDGLDPRRRYWDGSQWTDQYGSLDEVPPTNPTSRFRARIGRWRSRANSRGVGKPKRAEPEKMPKDQRTAILDAEVAIWTARGWILEGTLFGTQAIMRRSKLRLFGRDVRLVFLTFGLWLFYVVYRSAIGRTTALTIIVDRHGKVTAFERTDDTKSYGG
jgi:hypothetical protein